MKRVTASLIGLLIASSPMLAQEPVQEREHVVKKGDTLWDISAFYLNDPFQWPTIYQANTSVVEDPHWIYPEEVLVIPGIPGVSGDTEPQPEEPVVARARDEGVVVMAEPMEPPARTVFYRPPPERPSRTEDPTVLSEPGFTDVPVPPGEFNAAPFVASPGDLEVMGEFVRALRANRDVGGDPTAHPEEQVFLRYTSGDQPEVGQSLLLLRVGDRIGAFSAQRILEPTGVVRITQLNQEVMQGRIETQYGPVHKGDLAVPLPMYPDFLVESATPLESGPDLEGRVIRFLTERPMPSRADVAFINLGGQDGVAVGDLFAAYLPERNARARELGNLVTRIERLPPENVAVLRVIRVTDNVATVKVDQLMLPHLEDGIRVRRTHSIQ